MFTYKAEIKSGPLLEVKYYKSIRKRNKKNLARQINQSRTCLLYTSDAADD